ncbi:hypothetical protein, partial [Clostridium sp.]|uniref:hypothetical protein n=1 Tax=Clostridium sp. TaxID=1506 RepID=UPI002FC9D99E
MSKKYVNKFTTKLLILSFILSIFSPFVLIKNVSAETKFAYLTIEHYDAQGNRIGREEKTGALVGNKATVSFYLEERPGYKYSKHMLSNGATGDYDPDKNLFSISLTSSQDYDNPGVLKIKYDNVSNDFSITVKGYVTDKNGANGSYFSTRKVSAKNKETNIEEPEGVNDNWEFVNAIINNSDTPTPTSINPTTKIRELKFTPTGDSTVVFNYKDKGLGGTKDIRVVSLAVALDENNEVIRDENGRWEFARTDKMVKGTVGGTVTISTPAPTLPPQYKDFKYVYTWDDTMLTGVWDSANEQIKDGKKYTSTSVKIPVTGPRDNYYVYFYYKKNASPPEEGGTGEIVFVPHQTTWTNQGKISNGSGRYPVDVIYKGDEVITKNANYEWTEKVEETDDEGNVTTKEIKHTGTFPVRWNFERMVVSGSESATIKGMRGTVVIDQEGYHQNLSAIGYYSQPQYTLPSPCDSYTLPPNPPNPTGKSGYYDLDWTDPTTSFSVTPKIFNEANGATRGQSKKGIDQAYFGTLTSRDNL